MFWAMQSLWNPLWRIFVCIILYLKYIYFGFGIKEMLALYSKLRNMYSSVFWKSLYRTGFISSLNFVKIPQWSYLNGNILVSRNLTKNVILS